MKSSIKTPPTRRRSLSARAVLAISALLATLLVPQTAATALDESDFTNEFVVGGMTNTVSMDWIPDGRALIAAKDGTIHLANLANGTKSTYLTVPNVDATGERGLLDIYVHPDFANNNYFYVYYSQAPSTQLHVDRYTFTGNGSTDAASRTVIWTNPGPNHSNYGEYHIGGSLNIGPDNMFYLGVGDGFASANAQLLTNVFGKILRFDQSGNAPSSNPFYDGAGPNVDEIWAIGIRNPWRASFDDVTGRYYIGDVGGNSAAVAYEEVNVGVAGANYGWPACEGPLGPPKNGPDCPSGTTGPIHYYAHAPGGSCCQNASISGGEIVRGSQLPSELQGAYVFAEFAQSEARYLTLDTSGNVTGSHLLKGLGSHFPAWIGQGPDGHIYYVRYGYVANNSSIHRLRYNGATNQPPIITQASANVTSGATPLNVSFTGAANDPEGDPLQYLWTFGDGATSTQQSPSHTYTAQGTYSAQLTVTAAGQTTNSAPIDITAGSAPVVTITSPVHQSTFVANQQITLSGTATDDGPLNNSSYSWNVRLQHDNHEHPALTDVIGATVLFTIPDIGHDFSGDTSFTIDLTVTDSIGLTTTKSVEIEPLKIDIDVDATASVPTLVIDDITRSVPFTIDTIQGFRHTVAASNQSCGAGLATVFNNWSDSGAATHELVAPATSTSLTAAYGIPPTPYEPDLPCTGAPIGQITSPPSGSSVPVGPVDLDLLLTDDVQLGSGRWRVIDVVSGKYWNAATQLFQTAPLWNPLPAVPSGTTRLETSVSFTGGVSGKLYRSRIQVTDAANNVADGPLVTFKIADEIAPEATITAPVHNGNYSPGPLTLQATITDDVAVSGSAFLLVDTLAGKLWDANTNQWVSGWAFIVNAPPPTSTTSHDVSYSLNPIGGSGIYQLHLLVFDTAGNVGVAPAVSFFVDPE